MWCKTAKKTPGNAAKIVLLGAILTGLCSASRANTTAVETTTSRPAAEAVPAPAASSASLEAAQTVMRTDASMRAAPVRIALLLPLHSDTLNQAADAVRAGFLAAHEREQDGISVSVIESGDAASEVLSGYTAAVARHDIVVGPLTRSGAAAVAQSGTVDKPTIALTQPETAEAELPRQMLAIGLSVEDEARQAALWASGNKKLGKAFVVSTASAWQRRAAKAFAAQWQRQGREVETVELNAPGGYLSAKGLSELKKHVQVDKGAMVFAALDARQARQLRAAIGSDIPLYGTSQLNPFALADWNEAERTADMDGARLLDIPWQLQRDHPAVMVYPRPVAGGDQKSNPDLERLYALGIDAFRVAREIALRRTSFELDGVTGRLTVRFGAATPFFERIEQQAVYRDGSVTAVADMQ